MRGAFGKQRLILLIAACAAALLLPASAGAEASEAEGPGLVFSPQEWDFGSLTPGTRARLTLTVDNPGPRAVTVSILPTCDCLTVGPSRLTIAAGSQGEFQLTILAEEDEAGAVQETFLVQTNDPRRPWFYYPVHGAVSPQSGKPEGEGSGS
jgi:hypothetical protein